MKFFKNFDFIILLVVIIIGLFSLTMIWSLTPNLFGQQLTFFLVGLTFFFIISGLDIRIYSNLAWFLYFFSLALLLSTFVLGEVTRGSTRWIQVGSLTLQTSEMVKPLLVLFFASLFSRWEEIKVSYLVLILPLLLVPLFLVFKQPDLGSSLVIVAVLVGIIIGCGVSRSKVLLGILGVALLAPVIWFSLHDYQKVRITSFLNPYSDPMGSGYHLIQSVITVGSGQVFGRGLGRGTQSHLAFLPERHTDFIFASLTEELGFVGGSILLVLYFFLLWRILIQGQDSSSKFGLLICTGVFSMLSFQVLVNLGMNMGLLPITGITLPLVSYGGSSILSVLISLGLVQAVAKGKKRQQMIEIR